MHIKKIGHCCLVIDVDGVRLLTDPGAFSAEQEDVTGIRAVLVTHEHGDHLHVGSLRAVLARNPDATIITNAAVGAILAAEGLAYTVLETGNGTSIDSISVKAFDARHEEIFGEIGQVQNTGFLVADRLFYPGDAYCEPGIPIDVLALPVAGPWCKIPDTIRYALRVKPRIAFPVHDGMLVPERIGSSHAAPAAFLSEAGVGFVSLKAGEEADF